MEARYAIILLATGLATEPALAASPFDGTWRADMSKSQFSEKPDIMVLKGGVYSCPSCTPPHTVKADGAYHPVKGDGMDEMAVDVVDAHTIKISTKYKGKLMGVGLTTALPDGKTATYHFTSYAAPSGTPPVYQGEEVKIAPGPAGSHAISGTWKYKQGTASATENAMSMGLKLEGKMLTLSTKTGVGYTAQIGGPAVPIKGDPTGGLAAVKMTGPSTLVETDTLKGKIVEVSTIALAADGKTMVLTSVDPVAKTTDKLVLVKQ